MTGEQAKKWAPTAAILGYAMLALDVFPCGLDKLCLHGFDGYKFVAWFVIPFAICLPRMDWGYLGIGRWKRCDWAFLAVLAAIGVVAVLAIQVFPSLGKIYPGYGRFPIETRMLIAKRHLLWIVWWLVGWGFLHRYFLLTHVGKCWPRFGWLVIPLSEGVYHLTKPPLEAAGMVIFSLVLTFWALKRRNALLPFLAHLLIELELLVYLMLT